MRWEHPEASKISDYDMMDIDGTAVYVHRAIKATANARIDAVTGGVGTKLIFLGFAGLK